MYIKKLNFKKIIKIKNVPGAFQLPNAPVSAAPEPKPFTPKIPKFSYNFKPQSHPSAKKNPNHTAPIHQFSKSFIKNPTKQTLEIAIQFGSRNWGKRHEIRIMNSELSTVDV
jgi:hypothetical protein